MELFLTQLIIVFAVIITILLAVATYKLVYTKMLQQDSETGKDNEDSTEEIMITRRIKKRYVDTDLNDETKGGDANESNV